MIYTYLPTNIFHLRLLTFCAYGGFVVLIRINLDLVHWNAFLEKSELDCWKSE